MLIERHPPTPTPHPRLVQVVLGAHLEKQQLSQGFSNLGFIRVTGKPGKSRGLRPFNEPSLQPMLTPRQVEEALRSAASTCGRFLRAQPGAWHSGSFINTRWLSGYKLREAPY